jgi:drug/metabolite transporter (DMT)-like permease
MFYLIVFVFLTLLTQVLLKKESLKITEKSSGKYVFKMLSSPVVILAYSLSLLNMLLFVLVLTQMSLSKTLFATSSLYVLIIIVDYFFFNEKVNLVKLIGGFSISCGVIINFI